MNLLVQELLRQYRAGTLKPAEVVDHICRRIVEQGDDHVWIYRLSPEELRARTASLQQGPADLPLYGVPFAIKDNIDLAGAPTTAGCPAFAYEPLQTATVVAKLLQAGAILIGKTNLDQFATGLVGVRSPYGVARNPFDAGYIPGGSSSGSAVAVSAGLVSFALGTDTAGSGRVPAAFNNIVGLKPTRGALSARGVVPACRTLDCVSVFALTCADAALVADVAKGFDPLDSFSRAEVPGRGFAMNGVGEFSFGVPDKLEFFGDTAAHELYENAVRSLEQLGGHPVTIAYEPFCEAADLLYSGPWVAERAAALKSFFATKAEAAHPITRRIIEGASRYSAVDTFEAIYRLAVLKRRCDDVWEEVAVLLTPTAGTTYKIAEVEASPIQSNTNLGFYTNFVNLLGYCAVAVPAGFTPAGLPFGVSVVAPAGLDDLALSIADRLHRMSALTLGASKAIVPVRPSMPGWTALAVVGAHLRGLPLNWELISNGARFVRQCRTAPCYRLYELPGSVPAKPGLMRTNGAGAAIEVEVWEMPLSEFGRFVDRVPPPLAIGNVCLESGELVKGYLCEPSAADGARDISDAGGWRQYLAGMETYGKETAG